jgi:L-rhamnose mutarotase
MTHRHCFALDLIDDCAAVDTYEAWHRPPKTPREIIAFFRGHRVEDLQIYRAGNRLFMILDLSDEISADDFARAGGDDSAMRAWAASMATYQQPITFGNVPATSPSHSWVSMSELFSLKDHP